MCSFLSGCWLRSHDSYSWQFFLFFHFSLFSFSLPRFPIANQVCPDTHTHTQHTGRFLLFWFKTLRRQNFHFVCNFFQPSSLKRIPSVQSTSSSRNMWSTLTIYVHTYKHIYILIFCNPYTVPSNRHQSVCSSLSTHFSFNPAGRVLICYFHHHNPSSFTISLNAFSSNWFQAMIARLFLIFCLKNKKMKNSHTPASAWLLCVATSWYAERTSLNSITARPAFNLLTDKHFRMYNRQTIH